MIANVQQQIQLNFYLPDVPGSEDLHVKREMKNEINNLIKSKHVCTRKYKNGVKSSNAAEPGGNKLLDKNEQWREKKKTSTINNSKLRFGGNWKDMFPLASVQCPTSRKSKPELKEICATFKFHLQ